ncbi:MULTISPECIES: Zn-ribbon domain-containing OB-fold protein [Cupriavidus]
MTTSTNTTSANTTATRYLPPGLPAPVADADGLTAPYWDALRGERLLVQRCPRCHAWQWGPEWLCHRCHSLEIAYVEVAPAGVLYSWQRVWHPVHPALDRAGPYLIGLVELPDAGRVRMVGNILGDPLRPPRIGEPMRGVFEHAVDARQRPYTLLHWAPAAG